MWNKAGNIEGRGGTHIEGITKGQLGVCEKRARKINDKYEIGRKAHTDPDYEEKLHQFKRLKAEFN